MVPFPSEWRQHFGVDLVTALPPELGARFRYHERLRPQPSFSTIVHDVLARDPEFVVHEVGDMVRIVTVEGEYGAWVRIDGVREGRRAVRFIGAVLADELATVLEAIAILPMHFAAVERHSIELLRAERLHLHGRPRRFFYLPPIGWQPVVSGVTANWYPLDFPNNRSMIAVPPAMRRSESAEHARELALERAAAGLDVEQVARDELIAASGITGTCMRVHGKRTSDSICREVAVFVVDEHVYTFRLETTMADRAIELGGVLRGVAGSFKPLPGVAEIRAGTPFVTHPADVFDHWTI